MAAHRRVCSGAESLGRDQSGEQEACGRTVRRCGTGTRAVGLQRRRAATTRSTTGPRRSATRSQPQLQEDRERQRRHPAADRRTTASPPTSRRPTRRPSRQISDAYKALGAAVDIGGRAAGRRRREATQKEAVKELNASSAAYADLKKKVDALDTKDQAKFADGLKGVADELNKISKSGDEALRKLQSGEVGKAMAKQPGCQKPTASVAPDRLGRAVRARPARRRNRQPSRTGPRRAQVGCRAGAVVGGERPQWAGEYAPASPRPTARPGSAKPCSPPTSPPTGCSTCSARPPTPRWPAARPCPRCGPPAGDARSRRSSGSSCSSGPSPYERARGRAAAGRSAWPTAG